MPPNEKLKVECGVGRPAADPAAADDAAPAHMHLLQPPSMYVRSQDEMPSLHYVQSAPQRFSAPNMYYGEFTNLRSCTWTGGVMYRNQCFLV